MYNPWYIKPLFASATRLPVLPQPPSFSIIAAVNNPLPSLLMITPVPRSTRARPALEVPNNGVPVYLNNVNSPGIFHSSNLSMLVFN
jgi:hypothetical protein